MLMSRLCNIQNEETDTLVQCTSRAGDFEIQNGHSDVLECKHSPLNLGLSWEGRRLRLLLWLLLLLRSLSGCWSEGGFNNPAAKASCNHGNAHLESSRHRDRYIWSRNECMHGRMSAEKHHMMHVQDLRQLLSVSLCPVNTGDCN